MRVRVFRPGVVCFPPFPRVSGNRPIAKSRDRSPCVYCSLNNNIMYSESIVFYNRVILLSSFSLANSLYYIIYFPSYTKKKKVQNHKPLHFIEYLVHIYTKSRISTIFPPIYRHLYTIKLPPLVFWRLLYCRLCRLNILELTYNIYYISL